MENYVKDQLNHLNRLRVVKMIEELNRVSLRDTESTFAIQNELFHILLIGRRSRFFEFYN